MAQKLPDMVIKSNSLIEASYSLTLQEMRLLDMALAELTSYDEIEKVICTMPDSIVIRAEEYAKLYKTDIDTAYQALRGGSKKLLRRSFTYKINSEIMPTHKEVWEASWVRKIGYIEGHATVMLAFTPELIQLAGQLKNTFSRYHIEQKAPLTSQYAHRLYEMMMQWRTTKVVPSIAYDELRNRFDIDKKEYDRVTNFKARVLDPAVKQINEHTDITVSYKQYKEGRRVAGFVFKFKFKNDRKKVLKEINKAVDVTNPTVNAKSISLKIPPLTDKQINTFANKLANLMEFGRDIAPVGKSREDVVNWLLEELKDNDRVNEWRKYMMIVGYEFPDNLKK